MYQNIEDFSEKYEIQALQWLNLEIEKAFSDLSLELIHSARIMLTTENNPEGIIKAASGRHSDSLMVKVEKTAQYNDTLYLYSNVPYDITILTGQPFQVPTPQVLYIWITRKQRRGVFTGAKRGSYATLPFNYVGYVIEKEKDNIISRFQRIGK